MLIDGTGDKSGATCTQRRRESTISDLETPSPPYLKTITELTPCSSPCSLEDHQYLSPPSRRRWSERRLFLSLKITVSPFLSLKKSTQHTQVHFVHDHLLFIRVLILPYPINY